MPKLVCKLVGGYFRPPTQGITKALEGGDVLELVREPENTHDKNAIAVWGDLERIFGTTEPTEPMSTRLRVLETEVGVQGWELTEVLGKKKWHLGYIPKEIAAELVKKDFNPKGEYCFTAEGKPGVRVTLL